MNKLTDGGGIKSSTTKLTSLLTVKGFSFSVKVGRRRRDFLRNSQNSFKTRPIYGTSWERDKINYGIIRYHNFTARDSLTDIKSSKIRVWF